LGGASQPGDCPRAQTLELLLRSCPGQVGILGACRLRVMVGKQRRVLVAPAAKALDPRGEVRVQVGSPRLRNAFVRHFARDCVLDRVFALTLDRGSQSKPDEISFLEEAE